MDIPIPVILFNSLKGFMNGKSTETHTIGYGTYIMVWLGLVGFTAMTVTVAGFNLGALTIVMALMIAISKSMLVGTYFMHLKFEKTVFRIFVSVCIITLIIIIALTFSDLSFR
jgi:cytochrome c oxidase subunit 4